MNSWKEFLEKTDRLGKLTRFSYAGKNKYKHVLIKSICDCGKEVIRPFVAMTRCLEGKFVASCGCSRKETVKNIGLKNRKYYLEGDLSLESEEKSYIMGFYCADGYNNGYSVKLSLQIRDWEILEKIRIFMKYTGKVSFEEKFNKCHLQFHGEGISEIFKNEGVIKNKTNNFEIPEKYKFDKHFWRGFVDGDGCLFLYENYKYPTFGISLVGRESVINDFLDFCNSFTNISNNPSKMKNTTVYQLTITSKKAYSIIEYLYEGSNISLNRKKQKYENIKQFFKGKINE